MSTRVLVNGIEPTYDELVYWNDLFEGPGRYPLQPAYPIVGNPEATPECDANYSGVIVALKNGSSETRLPDRIGYEP